MMNIIVIEMLMIMMTLELITILINKANRAATIALVRADFRVNIYPI